jgi:hypothetical protein
VTTAGSPATPTKPPEAPLLPERAILLHIGPHKTGTTSIQYAFHLSRDRLARLGVTYAGHRRHTPWAAQAVRGVTPLPAHRQGLAQWREMVDEAHRADGRVVFSSEWYSEATPAAIPRIIGDLGLDRVHVVVTLRAFASILPSQWQQYVQAGMHTPYAEWLEGVLKSPDRNATPSFWKRQRHDALIERWASVVGPDRLTAVISDDRDHRVLLASFEQMLGLPPETLAVERDTSNRSLTWPEVEVLRSIHAALDGAGVNTGLRRELVLFGAAPALRARRPGPDEPRIATPGWALEAAGAFGREIADGIAASGVHVVGDLGALSRPPATGAGASAVDPAAWPEIAGIAARGLLSRGGVLPTVAGQAPGAIPLGRISTVHLVSVVARRIWRVLDPRELLIFIKRARRALARRLLGR